MKRNIVIVVLLIIALIVGFVIGRDTANIKNPLSTSNSEQVTENMQGATTTLPQSTSTVPVENTTFDSSEMTPEQRELLGTFGIDADAVVVTATMISCAETKIGKARLEEIFGGSTPTFFEGLDLFSCYEQ